MYSQPISDKAAKKLGLNDDDSAYEERDVKAQRMGKLFDDIGFGDKKINLKTRLGWKWKDLKGFYSDIKYTVRNLIQSILG